MSHLIGLIFIWGAWIYVMCALFHARRTAKKVALAAPDYFSNNHKTWVKVLNWQSSFSVIKLISDSDIESRGYSGDLVASIKSSKLMYATVPFAFVLFIVGAMLR